MADDSNVKMGVDTERLRVRHAFLLSVFGLGPAAGLTVFLVMATKTKVETSAEVIAIVGLFTSVSGTLVGAFFGMHIGAAGAEHERRIRQSVEENRQRAEEIT